MFMNWNDGTRCTELVFRKIYQNESVTSQVITVFIFSGHEPGVIR